MKKVMIVLTVLAVGFTSCKKDETTTKTTSEKIVGTWMGDETVLEIVAPPPIGNQLITESLTYLNIKINSDGTYTADSSGTAIETGNWSAPSSSTFILDGDSFNIKVLNDSQFHFGIDSSFTAAGVTGTISSTIKLKK